MIAKVRIAPVERWCAASLERHSERMDIAYKAVGREIFINPISMKQSNFCEGQSWRIYLESLIKIRHEIGSENTDTGLRICEHMLELD